MNEYNEMEEAIKSLLQNNADNENAKNSLAPLIAKTSLKMGHLYSDLGFESRAKMNTLMKENFSALAKIKPGDVRWKKYLYDSIGKVAPACTTCKDVTNCFSCELG